LSYIFADILGFREGEAAVEAVGFEARGHGPDAGEQPATVLNDIMSVARVGAGLGIPGLYVTGDPGGIDEEAKIGSLRVRLGLGWAKSHRFQTGQCPVKRYNRELMMAILGGKAQIAKAVNATVISLDDAPEGYQEFDRGAARKYVIDPHGIVRDKGPA
jgi:glutathione-independent formaldehyde dehydrogenase